MNFYKTLGILCGIVFTGILIFVIKAAKKDNRVKCEYDERQAVTRGKGYQIAFWVLVVYNVLYGLLEVMEIQIPAERIAVIVIGICLAICVHVVYCIMNDAYFALNENPRRLLIIFFSCTVLNFVLAANSIETGEIFTDGILGYRSVNLTCGIMFLIIFCALFIKGKISAAEAE